MRLILRWLINAGAIMLLPYIISSISVKSFYSALIVALIYGLVLAVIRPILVILTLPINLLTLGLFTFVINALLFWLVSSVVKGFEVPGFWAAFAGALFMSIVSLATGWFLKK